MKSDEDVALLAKGLDQGWGFELLKYDVGDLKQRYPPSNGAGQD